MEFGCNAAICSMWTAPLPWAQWLSGKSIWLVFRRSWVWIPELFRINSISLSHSTHHHNVNLWTVQYCEASFAPRVHISLPKSNLLSIFCTQPFDASNQTEQPHNHNFWDNFLCDWSNTHGRLSVNTTWSLHWIQSVSPPWACSRCLQHQPSSLPNYSPWLPMVEWQLIAQYHCCDDFRGRSWCCH